MLHSPINDDIPGNIVMQSKISPLYLLCLVWAMLLPACIPTSPAPIATVPTGSALTISPTSPAVDYQARPLQLPSLAAGQACPRQTPQLITERFGSALGAGPVYAAGFATSGTLGFLDPPPASSLFARSDWNGAKVLWFIAPTYTGPVRIRGGRIDASGELRFDQDQPLASDIHIAAMSAQETPNWRDRPSFTRFQSAGCYAYQVDGEDFSYTIVFEAVPVE